MTAAPQPSELQAQSAFASSLVVEDYDAAGLSAPNFISRLGAEIFGSFLLVFAGIGLAVYASELNLDSLGITLGIGLALMAGLATVGHISGHFNPAVTLGSAIAGRTQWRDVLPLWLSQLVGGAIAAGVLFLAVPTSLFGSGKLAETSRALMDRAANGFDTHAPLYTIAKSDFFGQFISQGITPAQVEDAIAQGQLEAPAWPSVPLTSALLIEVIATALFVGVFLAVTGKVTRGVTAPVVIGLAFSALLLIATPFTNGSLNPARSFASALFAQPWALGQLWLFFAAPLLGAAIAGLVYRLAIVQPAPLLVDFDEDPEFGHDVEFGTDIDTDLETSTGSETVSDEPVTADSADSLTDEPGAPEEDDLLDENTGEVVDGQTDTSDPDEDRPGV